MTGVTCWRRQEQGKWRKGRERFSLYPFCNFKTFEKKKKLLNHVYVIFIQNTKFKSYEQ